MRMRCLGWIQKKNQKIRIDSLLIFIFKCICSMRSRAKLTEWLMLSENVETTFRAIMIFIQTTLHEKWNQTTWRTYQNTASPNPCIGSISRLLIHNCGYTKFTTWTSCFIRKIELCLVSMLISLYPSCRFYCCCGIWYGGLFLGGWKGGWTICGCWGNCPCWIECDW